MRKEGTDRDGVLSSEDQRIISTSNSVHTNSTESNGTADSGLMWKERTPLAVSERISSGTGGERMQSPVGLHAVDKGVGGGGGEEWICSACSLTNSSLCRRCLNCDALKTN